MKILTIEDLKNIRYNINNKNDYEDTKAFKNNSEIAIEQLINILETPPADRTIKDIMFDFLKHYMQIDIDYDGEDIEVKIIFDGKLVCENSCIVNRRD